jgi:hypothetical protein
MVALPEGWRGPIFQLFLDGVVDSSPHSPHGECDECGNKIPLADLIGTDDGREVECPASRSPYDLIWACEDCLDCILLGCIWERIEKPSRLVSRLVSVTVRRGAEEKRFPLPEGQEVALAYLILQYTSQVLPRGVKVVEAGTSVFMRTTNVRDVISHNEDDGAPAPHEARDDWFVVLAIHGESRFLGRAEPLADPHRPLDDAGDMGCHGPCADP